MENYRNSNNLKEIVTAFKHIKFGEQDLLIWQTNDQGRTVVPGTIDVIDYKINSVSIVPSQKDKSFAFDKKKEIFIHSPFKGAVFKTEDYTSTPNILVFQIPNEVHFIETRSEQRHDVSTQEYPISFEPLSSYRHGTAGKKGQVFDISKTGVGFTFSAKDQGTPLQNEDTIIIAQIGETFLDPPIEGSVRYVATVKNHKTNIPKYYRVGVKLKKELNLQELIFKREDGKA